MKELVIESRHYDKDGGTCLRCSKTGKTLSEVVAELQHELAPLKIRVLLSETKLPEEKMPASNMVLFNGTPLEELLPNASVSETSCVSCGCRTGKETFCRAIEYEGKVYEELPEDLIRKAAFKSLGLKKA